MQTIRLVYGLESPAFKNVIPNIIYYLKSPLFKQVKPLTRFFFKPVIPKVSCVKVGGKRMYCVKELDGF